MKHLFQARLAQSRKDRYMELKAWRESRTARKTLGSGLEVTLRKVSLLDLAMNGDIPNSLAGMVDEMIDSSKATEVKTADFGQYGQIINLVVKACMAEPQVADEADDTHIALEELPMDDRLEVFDWANEGVEKIAPFREKQKELLEAVQPGDGIR